MSLKKKKFGASEVPIYDEAIIYQREDIWQFRMWLTKERRYVRLSLKTKNKELAEDKAERHYIAIKADIQYGKTYYSLNCKQGVEAYLEQRKTEINTDGSGHGIVPGRYQTIKTHLEHWLDFIGRDTKLKELEVLSCENYSNSRSKTKNKNGVSYSTIANEQSTINSIIKWLNKRKETYISEFEFKKIHVQKKKEEDLRRSSFSDEEVGDIRDYLLKYVSESKNNTDDIAAISKTIAGYYLLVASISGLRTGEQRQLKWKDINFEVAHKDGQKIDVVHINVRAETSKVRKSRGFYVRDREYFDELFKYSMKGKKNISENMIFTVNGLSPISERTILYHFNKVIEEVGISKKNRDLVPYSFRHYFITSRIKSGLTYRAIADMCGTSSAQIEKTYYHIDKDIKLTQALADYIVTDDGIIIEK